MMLDDNIYLCGRTIRNNSRGFDGQLAELLIFDASLTAAQIEGLYMIEQVSTPPRGDPTSTGSASVFLPVCHCVVCLPL